MAKQDAPRTDATAAAQQEKVYTCAACKQSKGTAEKMFNVRGIPEKEGILDVIICRTCTSAAREFGYEVYHLNDTLRLIARRKAERAAEQARQQKAGRTFFADAFVKAEADGETNGQQPARERRRANQAARVQERQGWDYARELASGEHRNGVSV